MHTRQQNSGWLDRFRIFAALLVVAIHTSPLTSFSEGADFFLTRILARVAVPFFLMMTGHFVAGGFLNPSVRTSARLHKFLQKTAYLYVFCILLYLPIGLYAGHYTEMSVGLAFRMVLFDGTFYHLWYFPACILGILLVHLMSRFLSLGWMTAVSVFLYGIGLFGDSYYGLIQKVPALEKMYGGLFQVFSYTRNGLFLAPIFLVLGMWMAVGQEQGWPDSLSPLLRFGGLGVSFAAMTAEAFTLRHFALQRHDSMYLALVPVMFFLYLCLLYPHVDTKKELRTAAAWIYILHPAFIVVVRGIAKALHLTGLLVDNSLIHYIAVAALSLAAGFIVSSFREGIKLPLFSRRLGDGRKRGTRENESILPEEAYDGHGEEEDSNMQETEYGNDYENWDEERQESWDERDTAGSENSHSTVGDSENQPESTISGISGTAREYMTLHDTDQRPDMNPEAEQFSDGFQGTEQQFDINPEAEQLPDGFQEAAQQFDLDPEAEQEQFPDGFQETEQQFDTDPEAEQFSDGFQETEQQFDTDPEAEQQFVKGQEAAAQVSKNASEGDDMDGYFLKIMSGKKNRCSQERMALSATREWQRENLLPAEDNIQQNSDFTAEPDQQDDIFPNAEAGIEEEAEMWASGLPSPESGHQQDAPSPSESGQPKDGFPAQDRQGKYASLPLEDPCSRAWIELDAAALNQNVELFRSRIPEHCRLMPAVKADAYGHGIIPISRLLARMGVDAFCVACLSEGIAMRKAGISGEILILGYTAPQDFQLLRDYNLSQTVVDYPYAQELNRFGENLHVHIGIDTGMHRIGIRCEEIEEITGIYHMENLSIDGLFTHLCVSDSPHPEHRAFTSGQLRAFYQVVQILKEEGYPCHGLHILASYGILNLLKDRRENPRTSKLPSGGRGGLDAEQLAGDYVRPGIALYGVLSTQADQNVWKGSLAPVLSLKARVTSIRFLHAGESVSYGITFTADREMKIAAVSIGYADGLPRELSNGRGSVLINGRRAPIIGRICMDQCIVDVSRIPDVKRGDIAVMIGRSGKEEITAAQIAETCGTISHEILTGLAARLGRIVTGQ